MAVTAVLVGCGAMSRGWLEALAQVPEFEIVGLVDLDPEAARRQAEAFGLGAAAIGSDLAEMLARTRPAAVFDVVVPPARHDVVALALSRGCHVLSEKPMAATLEEARDLVERARVAGRIHAVIQNRRYLDGIRRLRAVLDSGAIGAVTSLHCDFFLGPHFGGFREAMDHVLLLDMAIHTFDAARYVSGAVPLAVYCHESNPRNSWYRAGASASAIFEFSEGVTFTYRGSWCAEGLRTSWESAWRVIGETGSLTWDGADTFLAERVVATGDFFSEVEPVAVPELAPGVRVGGHLGVIQDFLLAIQTGRPPETRGEDNVRSLAMVSAAIRSAQTRARVELERF